MLSNSIKKYWVTYHFSFPGRNALSVHLAIDMFADSEFVLRKAEKVIRNKFDIKQTTIQVEKYNEWIMRNCEACKVPS